MNKDFNYHSVKKMSDVEIEKEPVMNLSKMSVSERRRLTISPHFRERLSAVIAKKTTEIDQQSLKPVAEGGDGKIASNVPVSQELPVDVGLDESSRSSDKVKYTGTIPKNQHAWRIDTVLPESCDDRHDDDVLHAPGFNIPEGKSPRLGNNPLFHGMSWNTQSRQSMPISKWPIRYSGTDNGVGLNLFLRQVEFFAASEGMSKEDLFQSAH